MEVITLVKLNLIPKSDKEEDAKYGQMAQLMRGFGRKTELMAKGDCFMLMAMSMKEIG
jgi:hypothetical protein